MSKNYSTGRWAELCAFWGMVIAAFTHFFGGFFKALIKWFFEGKPIAGTLTRIADICSFLGNIALIFAIAIPAFRFVSTKGKGWKVFYWIALVMFILGVVFGVVINL